MGKSKKILSYILYGFAGICLVAAFSVIGSIVAFIFGLAFTGLILYFATKLSKQANNQETKKDEPVKEKESNPVLETENIKEPENTNNIHTEPVVKKQVQPDGTKKAIVDIVGSYYQQKSVKEMMKYLIDIGAVFENHDYEWTKKDMSEFGIYEEKVWKYEPSDIDVNIVPDPDNEHDHNALKVMAGWKDHMWHIGYIPKNHIHEVKVALDSGVEFTLTVLGGKYKILATDDEEHNDIVKNGTADYVFRLSFDKKI